MKRRTILLAEDNEELREATRDLLVDLGFEVSAASRSGEAVRLFESEGAPDVLVSEAGLPGGASVGLGGVELARELISRHTGLGVVLVTGGETEPGLEGRLDPSRVRTLKKPFSAAELADAVEESLTVRSSSPPWPRPRAETPPPAVAVPAPDRRLPRGRTLLAAAAVVLAAGVVYMTSELSAPALPELPEPGVGRGGTLELLGPVGELKELPAELVWEETPGAAGYRIRILGVDDAVLWQGTAEAPPIAFPRDLAGGLHAGVVYFWQVEAYGAGSEVLKRSSPARFLVAPGVRPLPSED